MAAAKAVERFKDIKWCEHNINAKYCVVCSNKKEEPKPTKRKKAVKTVVET